MHDIPIIDDKEMGFPSKVEYWTTVWDIHNGYFDLKSYESFHFTTRRNNLTQQHKEEVEIEVELELEVLCEFALYHKEQ